MNELRIRSLEGHEVTIPGAAMDRLRATVRGSMLFPTDPPYDSTRRIHNGMIDRRPALILRCSGAADVVTAVRFAAEFGLEISIRGGGHGVPGFAVTEGGLMLDLTSMKGIRVDPAERCARAEAGVVWGEFDHETQAFGLATTGGSARPTGIAGLTLAGGHGFLMRKHGLTCDNLLSADVVTADGWLRIASAVQNPDLFWGLRGGGGNFGIVTSFEYRLHPVGPMLGGLVIYPIDQAASILRSYHDFTGQAPDALGSLAILGTLPDGTRAVILLLAYNGPVHEGERVLRPLRTLAIPIADTVTPIAYTALQSIVEQFNPAGMRNYWKSSYLDDLGPDAVELLIDRYRHAPSPNSHVVLYTLGGAVARGDPDSTAVAYRDKRHILLWIGMWNSKSEDDLNRNWVRESWAAAGRFATPGFYVNYDADTRPDQLAAAYGAAKFQRLAALKARYDPGNLFRLNQNIPPDANPAATGRHAFPQSRDA